MINTDEPQVIEGIKGNCFDNIRIKTAFEYTSNDFSSLKLGIKLTMEDPVSYFCMENIYISTSFTDYYDFFFIGGNLSFT